MNVQFAVPRDGRGIFILEVNPRASRTVPFVSKVTGVPLAKIAARIAAGKTLKEMGIKEVTPKHVAVKEAVFPFAKFAGVDTILGPEMRSTGEVMGIDDDLRRRVRQEPDRRRHQAADGGHGVPVACRTATRPAPVAVAKGLIDLGFEVVATVGTHTFLTGKGHRRQARQQGARGTAAHRRPASSTATSSWSSTPPRARRRSRIRSRSGATRCCKGIPYYTTLSAARAAVGAIAELRAGKMTRPLAAGVPEWLSSR